MIYQVVNKVFEQPGSDMDAAEAHGMAVGMLSVEIRTDPASWLLEIEQDNINIYGEDEILLRKLFEQCRAQLAADIEEFAFDVFLPDDDEPLWEQAEALRNWCRGFLFGVGYAQSLLDWPGEIGEVMQDMVELTKLDCDSDHDEADAAALMEIREYLRAAVFTVRDYFLHSESTATH